MEMAKKRSPGPSVSRSKGWLEEADGYRTAMAAGGLQALAEIVKPNEVLEFCEALDVDFSGELKEQEFADGFANMAMLDMPIATHQMLKLLHLIQSKVGTLEKAATPDSVAVDANS